MIRFYTICSVLGAVGLVSFMFRMGLKRMNKKLTKWVPLLLLPLGANAATTAITQHGITWTLAGSPTVGQYTNGDYWVIGPVTVNSITPATDSHINGSMTNPSVAVSISDGPQGFTDWMQFKPYSAALNFATFLPSVVGAGTSILSCTNMATYQLGDNPEMGVIAVLTVVAGSPPVGSFRPAYVGTDKVSHWTATSLNWSVLKNLAPVANTPAIGTVSNWFVLPRIEIDTDWEGRYMHPNYNYPYVLGTVGTYGREIAETTAQGLLSLNLNYTAGQKSQLFIDMVQYGLDIYGARINGGIWYGNGGHNPGRLLPIVLAGMALGDTTILSAATNSGHYFSENQQMFYVDQNEVNVTASPQWNPDTRNGPALPYTTAMIGTAEWGMAHTINIYADNASWTAIYRDVVGPCSIGHELTAKIMGFNLGWPAFDDYMNRFWGVEHTYNVGDSANSIFLFEYAMWNAYGTNSSGGQTAIPSIALNPSEASLSNIVVTLSDATPFAAIFYTIDGSNPTTLSPRYTAPTTVTNSMILTAMATSAVNTQSPSVSSPVEVNNFLEWGQWHNVPFPSITTNKCLTFNVVVSTNDINAVIGFTATNFASQYTDLAGIVRFGPAGQVDARNGGVYMADNTFNYYSNSVYWISNFLNVANGTYSVYASSNGTTWVTIGSGYSYRTEQQPVTSLQNIGLYVLSINPSSIAPQDTMRAYNFQFFNTPTVPSGPDPSFDLQPTNATVAIGGSTNITTHATSAVLYQWYANGNVIAGATSNVYTVVNGQCPNNQTTYYCVATSAQGFQQQSTTVTLTVNGCDPVFVLQPANQSVAIPNTATFGARATGTAPLTYQWFKNSVSIGGATGLSYTTPATTSADNGAVYFVKVTNGNAVTVQSTSATLVLAVSRVTNLHVGRAFVTH